MCDKGTCQKCKLTVITKKGERGYSAYDVAVQNGFEGTATEWLESLVGPEGPAGTFDLTTISYEETNDKSVSSGDNKIFTNIPVPDEGTYLLLFEADVDNDGNDNNFVFDYYAMKNDAFVPIGGTRTCFIKNTGVVSKICLFDFISLAGVNTININANVTTVTAGQVIGKRSVKLLKIA